MTQNPSTNDTVYAQISAADEQYFMPVFGKRTPLCIVAGHGVYLTDSADNQYLDMIGGIAVNVLGHAHPRLTAAICEQAKRLVHCSNYYYNIPQTQLAERLALLSGLPGAHVFFGNSGAEVNEAAIKLARGYFYYQGQPRSKIISAVKSFHGRTLATATATGQSKYSQAFAPLPAGFEHIPYNDTRVMLSAIDHQTCAVIMELVQGESGVIPADPEYMHMIEKRCRETGALLIIDEIQTGIGRTGHFLASSHYGLQPDMITLAKGLAGGLPIGAIIANGKASSGFHIGDHGSTFGGNPLVCRAGLAVLDELEASHLVENAAITGTLLQNGIRELSRMTGLISDVRGLGLMIGFELNKPVAPDVKRALILEGVLVGSVGDRIVRLLPPLILEESHVEIFLQKLKNVLEALPV
ncbi:MAG: aspartate aminotransferase family protein [Clostridiaceae bacterium]|nr:aspartate aminotransferase family protein [Clostridiaceae bacterium]